MQDVDKQRMRRERQACRDNADTRTQLQELRTQIQALSQTNIGIIPPSVTADTQTQVSQVTQGTTMMGGRNEQANRRQQQRDIRALTTTSRRIQATTSFSPAQPSAHTSAMNECDTNADTCVLGTNFLVLAYTTRTADVYAYDTSIRLLQNVPIVTGATAYDCPTTGKTFILVFHEALYYGMSLDHSLINPNQVRHFGIDF